MASDLGLHYLPMSQKKDARYIWIKMQLFYLSHKSCRNLGSKLLKKNLPSESALGTSDLSKLINMKIL